MKTYSGFTLIELMIVVAIISVIVIMGVPSMLRARQAANETSAITSCKTIAEAEEIYHRTDYDKNGVLEYATAMSGNYSLLETVAGSNDLGLVDKAFASAEGQPISTDGKNGYAFTILTSQGPAAGGGTRSYFTRTAMDLGYAISSTPCGYDLTGRMSYILGTNGTVLQKDRGATLPHETWYNPDTAWSPTE
ncbi:MAG: DUF2950 family protein [Planctomycetota bacterium]